MCNQRKAPSRLISQAFLEISLQEIPELFKSLNAWTGVYWKNGGTVELFGYVLDTWLIDGDWAGKTNLFQDCSIEDIRAFFHLLSLAEKDLEDAQAKGTLS